LQNAYKSDMPYNVVVIDDCNYMFDIIALYYMYDCNGVYTKETGKILLGDCEFGLDEFDRYHDHSKYVEPVFNECKPLMVEIKTDEKENPFSIDKSWVNIYVYIPA